MKSLVRDLKRRVKDPKAQVTNEFRFFKFEVRQNQVKCSFIAKSEPVNVTSNVTSNVTTNLTSNVTCNAVSLWFDFFSYRLLY